MNTGHPSVHIEPKIPEHPEIAAEAVVRRPGRRELFPERWLRRRKISDRVLASIPPLALLALWQGGVSLGYIDSRFFGSPINVLTTARTLLLDGELFQSLFDSVIRLVAGYVLGAAFGIVIGLALGQVRALRVAFEPFINALYVIPKLALLPILLLLIPGKEAPMIVLVAVAVFFVMSLSALSAAVMTPAGFIDVANSFSASRMTLFCKVVFPNSLPQLFSGLRLASGAAVLMLVGAEFVVGSSGLGYLVWHSWSLFLASQMYVGIVMIALLGVVFTLLINFIERRVIPWSHAGGFYDD